ncbi:MAG: AAA family ATPase [Bacteroidota bacterium]
MEQLLVQRFKAIRNEAGIPIPVKPVNVFMGEQASGKSTLAKLIYFFKTLGFELNQSLISIAQRPLPEDEIEDGIEVLFENALTNHFATLFGSIRHFDDFFIEYQSPTHQKIILQKSDDRLKIDLKSLNNPSLSELEAELNSSRQHISPKYPVNDKGSGKFIALMGFTDSVKETLSKWGLKNDIVLIPDNRGIVVALSNSMKDFYASIKHNIDFSIPVDRSNEYIFYNFIQYNDDLVRAYKFEGGFEGLRLNKEFLSGKPLSEELKLLLDVIEKRTYRVLKGEYSASKDVERIRIRDNQFVDLQNASSGQQAVIRLFQDLYSASLSEKPACRIYEEPESHLFPTSQKALMEAIACFISANPGNQIILPTHSPYTLLAIDNLIQAGEMAAEYPKLSDAITEKAGLEPPARLRFDQVGAWFLKDGEFISALSEERKGIIADYVDQIAEEMEETYTEILALGFDYANL